MTATTYRILDAVADSFNPLLALVAVAIPPLHKQRNLRAMIAYYISASAAIGFVYLVRALDSHYMLWASLGVDYSTHSALAASLVVSLGAVHRRWLAPLALATTVYFALELVMRYHGPADIASPALAAAVAALLLHVTAMRAFAMKMQRSESPLNAARRN